ncbi:MAG TPA: hypothetical protein VEI57_00270 [Nitrospirota bacterium]|nr:hypothetical protein [Nitrospirota bacterium]
MAGQRKRTAREALEMGRRMLISGELLVLQKNRAVRYRTYTAGGGADRGDTEVSRAESHAVRRYPSRNCEKPL